MKILIPRTGVEVSSDWLCEVIQNHEKKTHPDAIFNIKEFKVDKATKPGDNFNSELTRVDVEGEINVSGNIENKHYSFILKFESLNILNKEMNRATGSSLNELLLYSKIHKKLSDFQKCECNDKYNLNIPELFYSYKEGNDFVIIMKNMKQSGYVLNDKTRGLSAHQLNMAANQIARWHALSYAYNKKHNLLEEFPHLTRDNKSAEFLIQLIRNVVTISLPIISENPEFKELYAKLQNQEAMKKKLEKGLSLLKNPYMSDYTCCLVHGDYWNNNLLFTYNDEEKKLNERQPLDICVVDWQMARWGPALVDLQYLFNTSTNYDVRKGSLEDFLNCYYSTFDEIVMSLQCPSPWKTFQIFKDEFESLRLFGFLLGILFGMGTLSKAGETIDMVQVSSVVNVRSVGYSIKSTCAKYMVILMMKPSMAFFLRPMSKKMFNPIAKEIKKGNNEIMNARLLGLMQEAKDNGIFDDIPAL